MIACIASPVFALTVSPARVEVTGDPGTTLNGEIEIFNEQEGSRTFFTTFENFESNGDTGAPYFIGSKDDLATWIKTDKKVIIDSGRRNVIPYSIVIPQNAEPGGHFAAIFFGSQEPGKSDGSQLSVGGKIGVLILLRVTGEVKEGGGLQEFTSREGRFVSMLPVSFVYRLSNSGGDRIVPTGEIKIKNTFGLTTEKLPVNIKEGSILPGSARKFEVVWDGGQKPLESDEKLGFFEIAGRQWSEFHFGWYTAKMNLAYGATNQTVFAKYHFFVIPWQLLLIVLVILSIVGFIGKFGIKRYNKWIISQVQK